MRKRRSYEPGHRPKMLVIVDDSPEFDRALVFAARRAARIGAALLGLALIAPQETQAWLGVGDVLRQEAEEAAQGLLDAASRRAREVAGVAIETAIAVGKPVDEVLRYIDRDEDISILILAASSSSSGPGPLISALSGGAAAGLPVPLTIVPGGLSDAEIEALA